MKNCAIIAEYNPFHNGHLSHIDYVKNVLKAENVTVILSGNFTQRGEPAVLNKFTRAKHAVIAGADTVIELPTVFATANAEIFAKGSVNLIASLNNVDGICFGVESGTKEEYIRLATYLNDETKEFKKILKTFLDKGLSLGKAKFETVKAISGEEFDEGLINSPNNILALEYVKAIIKNKLDIEICPFLRSGDHHSNEIVKGITSASNIRDYIKLDKKRKISKTLPKFVYKDLTDYPYSFDKMIMTKLITTPVERLAEILDCTEGLENRIKALSKDTPVLEDLIEKVCTKRYTKTRIRRILTANLLGINADLVLSCLKQTPYIKVLAINNDKDVLSSLSATAKAPVLTRKSSVSQLKGISQKCFEIDVLANDLYNLATNGHENENQMFLI